MDLLVVFFSDGLCHVEEEGCFPGAGGRDDESALAASDGCDDVHDASCIAVWSGFEGDALVGIDRFEFVEVRKDGGFIGVHAVDLRDFYKLWAAVAGLVLAMEPLAVAKRVAADELRRDENIFFCLLEVRFWEAEKAEAFGSEFEYTVGIDRRAIEHGG